MATQSNHGPKVKKEWVKLPHLMPNDQAESKIFKACVHSSINRIERLGVWESQDNQQHLNGDKALALSGQGLAIFTSVHSIQLTYSVGQRKTHRHLWMYLELVNSPYEQRVSEEKYHSKERRYHFWYQ
jgi:hypothetical protein